MNASEIAAHGYMKLTEERLAYSGEGVKVVEDCATGEWSQTYTGKRYYPEAPRPDMIDLIDIAVALGNLTRYGGHCRFYSVAEHAVMVSKMVPPEDALEALHHDSSEAYLVDVIRPVKHALGKDNRYFELEKLAYQAVARKFGLREELPPSVKYMDSAICIAERRVLHPRANEWHFTQQEPPGIEIWGYPSSIATSEFIRRHCELVGESIRPYMQRLRELYEQDDKARIRHLEEIGE